MRKRRRNGRNGPLNSRTYAGDVSIFFGRETWYNPFDLSETGKQADVVIYGAGTNDLIGNDLASGDFNNDEILDLAIAARVADGPNVARHHRPLHRRRLDDRGRPDRVREGVG